MKNPIKFGTQYFELIYSKSVYSIVCTFDFDLTKDNQLFANGSWNWCHSNGNISIWKPKSTCAVKKVQHLCQDTEDTEGQPAENQKGYFHFLQDYILVGTWQRIQ